MSLLGRIERRGNTLNIPGRGLVLWRHIPKLLRSLGLLKDLKLSVDGADSLLEIDGGLHVKVGRGTEVSPNPFQLSTASDAAGYVRIYIEPGTVTNIMPQLGGEYLDAEEQPYFLRNPLATLYVYLRVDVTLATNGGFVMGGDLNVVDVGCTDTVPNDNTTSGEFYIVVGTITKGKVTAQDLQTSLYAFVEDDGSASSSGRLIWWRV